jgi:hypothetical protein
VIRVASRRPGRRDDRAVDSVCRRNSFGAFALIVNEAWTASKSKLERLGGD